MVIRSSAPRRVTSLVTLRAFRLTVRHAGPRPLGRRLGIAAYLVDVETDIANGLSSFATVGLPQGAVKEGRERVYAAVANTGYKFPLKRITG